MLAPMWEASVVKSRSQCAAFDRTMVVLSRASNSEQ